jgi:hypothetical protein
MGSSWRRAAIDAGDGCGLAAMRAMFGPHRLNIPPIHDVRICAPEPPRMFERHSEAPPL